MDGADLRTENERMVARAVALVEASRGAGITARLLGGAAILHRAPELSERLAMRGRVVRDIDLICRRAERQKLPDVMAGLGYSENDRLNALHGRVRNQFFGEDGDGQWEVDVFFDQLPMCHVIDFSRRLEIDPITLAPSDLLLAKLQIVELNEKDALDVWTLLTTHPLVEQEVEGGLDVGRILEVTENDWGFYHTVELNLRRVEAVIDSAGLDDPEEVIGRSRAIREAMERAPKGVRWRARARVGERVRWYNLVEELAR